MQCSNVGDWSVYVPTEAEIAEQTQIDAEWDTDRQVAFHKSRTSPSSGREALGETFGVEASPSHLDVLEKAASLADVVYRTPSGGRR